MAPLLVVILKILSSQKDFRTETRKSTRSACAALVSELVFKPQLTLNNFCHDVSGFIALGNSCRNVPLDGIRRMDPGDIRVADGDPLC